MRNFWIIAGEASGDMYGARLGRELIAIGKERGDKVKIAGMGGPAMIGADFDIRVDSTELGVMGVVEVMKLIFTFIRIFFSLTRAAVKERPDAVILIDYPGFNLLFALVMYWHKIPVIWYVCPHLWVWGKWRLPVLAKICTKMLVIFPFEQEVFAGTRLKAEFVGHPLLDIFGEKRDRSIKRDPNLFLLLPGSRSMEITRLMKPMLETVLELSKKHPKLRYVLSAPRDRVAIHCRQIYREFRQKHPETPELDFVVGETTHFQQLAGTGIAASGTVTVESAVAGLPLVVGYKLNFFTLLLASVLVKLYRGYFTMVNIIANKTVYEEFLQWHFRKEEILPAVEKILPGGERRAEVEAEMAEVVRLLSPQSSSAIRQAAEACYAIK